MQCGVFAVEEGDVAKNVGTRVIFCILVINFSFLKINIVKYCVNSITELHGFPIILYGII